ncbi:hypothetical protein Acsp06_45160 [Actinomycetospora sp. NBRC 106375]|uniref:hypothetical protein n=1 Tax=Actinomycetospora sp. NBRC 106375 TaxID=3032207 RepID=UPI0024A4E45D|nr:hypothetical protein [Actinomycetospora sp. NBRC 106375]GLZ48331.1 hypothetical protein Acsp06_45160 [Actinomycetospora sp. NBRC 106375]
MQDHDGPSGSETEADPAVEPPVPFGTASGVPAGYRPGSVAFGSDEPAGRARGRRRGPRRGCGR